MPALSAAGPPKGAALKSFATDPKTRSIPVKEANHVSPPVGKAEEMAGVRKRCQRTRFHNGPQPIKAFAHVSDSAKEIDARVWPDG